MIAVEEKLQPMKSIYLKLVEDVNLRIAIYKWGGEPEGDC